MNRKTLASMGAMLMAAASMSREDLFSLSNGIQESGRTYGDVSKPDTRSLREFTINGNKIIAYSRKDAIKRLKHKKK